MDIRTGKFVRPPIRSDYMFGLKWITGTGVGVANAMQVRAEDVVFTRNNGLPGPRPLNRIVGYDPATGRVATLYKGIDPRYSWSYGPWIAGHLGRSH